MRKRRRLTDDRSFVFVSVRFAVRSSHLIATCTTHDMVCLCFNVRCFHVWWRSLLGTFLLVSCVQHWSSGALANQRYILALSGVVQ